MSGVEEKPVKREAPLLRTDKSFSTLFDEYGEVLGSLRHMRRERARKGILFNTVFLVFNLFVGLWVLSVGGTVGVGNLLLCILFLYLIKRDVKIYIDNEEPLEGVNI